MSERTPTPETGFGQKREITLDAALDGEYRRCYVSAEPASPATRAAADEWTGKYGAIDGARTYRALIQHLAKTLPLDGVAVVELSDKDMDYELTWNVETNEWKFESYWESYTQSERTTASGMWDPR